MSIQTSELNIKTQLNHFCSKDIFFTSVYFLLNQYLDTMPLSPDNHCPAIPNFATFKSQISPPEFTNVGKVGTHHYKLQWTVRILDTNQHELYFVGRFHSKPTKKCNWMSMIMLCDKESTCTSQNNFDLALTLPSLTSAFQLSSLISPLSLSLSVISKAGIIS